MIIFLIGVTICINNCTNELFCVFNSFADNFSLVAIKNLPPLGLVLDLTFSVAPKIFVV